MIDFLRHLKTLETHKKQKSRLEWKIRLIRRLSQSGFDMEKLRFLLRVIDRKMRLSGAPKLEFKKRLAELAKEENMPFISEIEEDAMEEGMKKRIDLGRAEGIDLGREVGLHLGRIEMALELRFKKAGLALMPRIREVQDTGLLEQIAKTVRKAKSLKEVSVLIPPS